jgi:glycosyltransferase involved in cell wall biosynthesis
MNEMNKNKPGSSPRPRIALITNHGYAGVEIPIGGAPDTGGQNFYVNSLAQALEASGFETTIFARGGFPFFGIEKMREGSERLSEHTRYIYIPGGGDTFIRKEDISIALDEETVWLQEFIAKEAAEAGVKPWEHFEIVNTHYWDAAVIAVKLIERWRDQAAFEFLGSAAGGSLAPFLDLFEGSDLHRLGLYRGLNLHLGEIARAASAKGDTAEDIAKKLLGSESSIKFDLKDQDIVQTIRLGQALKQHLKIDGIDLDSMLDLVDRHVWTPHSLGIIKERNFWHKNKETVRSLKFRERDAHEQMICANTKLFCSTSSDILRALLSYHRVQPEGVFDFPPCIDTDMFRPRKESELEGAYRYLSKQSGIHRYLLKSAKIVFETSRMDNTKRKDVLLRAFAQVIQKRDDAYLFVGGGPTSSPVFDELISIEEELPILRGRAFLLGYIPAEVINQIFSLADLFVSCSEMEGFGMSISQAAASGVAVVASDLTPFATTLASDAAVVVQAGDVSGFASAMEQLLSNEEERSARAQKLLEIARRFNWLSTTDRFVAWFKDKREHKKS